MKKLLVILLLLASPVFAYTTKLYENFAGTSGAGTTHTIQAGYTGHCAIISNDGTSTDTITAKLTISGTLGPAVTLKAGESLSLGCGDTIQTFFSAVTITAGSGTPTYRVIVLETK